MAKLYFRYGVMGSSKTANALMVNYNYEERGQKALLTKPAVDRRDGERFVASRAGLSHPCVWFHEVMRMPEEALSSYACVIVDEAQFLSRDEVRYLTHLVDELNLPVICYGLRADFRGDLFPGSAELLASADIIEEVKTICWCGHKATCNTRFDENGRVLKEGEQVVLGANERYIGLCRKHWKEGNLGPEK
jgi:thymidine kinase